MAKYLHLIITDAYDRVLLLKPPGSYLWSATYTVSDSNSSPYVEIERIIKLLFEVRPEEIGKLQYKDILSVGSNRFIIYNLTIEKSNPLRIDYGYNIRMLNFNELLIDTKVCWKSYNTQTMAVFNNVQGGYKHELLS